MDREDSKVQNKVDEFSTRLIFGLDEDDSVDRRTIYGKLAEHFGDLRDANLEARPHVEFPLERDEFADALDRALNGETIYLEDDAREITLEPDLDRGNIALSIIVRQYDIEMQLSNWDGQVNQDGNIGEDTDILSEYYPSGGIHLQRRVKEFPVAPDYVTLFRDLSSDCRQAAELMNETVDGYEELIWGGEPELRDLDGSYHFSSTIYYRPTN